MNLFTYSLILFLIMDPIGNTRSLCQVMQQVDPSRRKAILGRETLLALAVMVAFNFLGEFFFDALGLSETAVRLASGLIMFMISFLMLFPKHEDGLYKSKEGGPFLFPIAIPMMAGPATLATIMLFAHSEPNISVLLGAIAIAWILVSASLLSATQLVRVLGDNGLTALERLMGMILLLLAVQRFMDGVKLFILQGS